MRRDEPRLGWRVSILVALAAGSLLAGAASSDASASATRPLGRNAGLPAFTSGVYALFVNGFNCTWKVTVSGSAINGTMLCPPATRTDPLSGTVDQGERITVTRDCTGAFAGCSQTYVATTFDGKSFGGTMTGSGGGGPFTLTPATPRVVPSPRPSAAKVNAAVAWSQKQLGSSSWAGRCEGFVEAAYGARTGYSSAAAAARQIGLRGGPIASVPRGALIYFRPNCPGATGKSGHVGISLGGGKMISALGEVTITDLKKSSHWTAAGAYSGWTYPPTEWPGRRP